MSFQPTPLPKEDRDLMIASLERIHEDIAECFRGTPTLASVPASTTSVGSRGDVAYNATHLYICVAKDTWRRVALSTF